MKNDDLRATAMTAMTWMTSSPRTPAKRGNNLVMQVAAGVFLGGLALWLVQLGATAALRQIDARHHYLRRLGQFGRALAGGVVIGDVQRFSDLALDRLGAFQAQDKAFGLATRAIQFISGAGLSDRIEQFFGVRPDPFGQADLSDAHANTSVWRTI
jgi:hypothetical protein